MIKLCDYCKKISKCNYCSKYGSVGVYLFLENSLWKQNKLVKAIPNVQSNENKIKNDRYHTKKNV